MVGTAPAHAPVRGDAPAASASAPSRTHLGRDLTLIVLVVVVGLGALAAGGVYLYRELYSPTAFVERYLSLLSDGRAADALAIPGVSIDSAQLNAAGLPLSASEVLLRQAALGSLTDVRTVSQRDEGDESLIEVSYVASGRPGTTTFRVERSGWIGVAPAWRFAQSPLAVLDLTVRGSMAFSVNGFEIDKRQVSVDGADAAPSDALPMLVFSPGTYRVSVDTAISATPGVDVLADKPLANVPVDVQAEPTAQFIEVVQQRVEDFLTACTTQDVLQPTGCPFGYVVSDRIQGAPTWSIVKQPTVSVEPSGDDWEIPAAAGVARIQVDVVSLYDGSVRHVDERVPFRVTGAITVLPDGTASIRVGG